MKILHLETGTHFYGGALQVLLLVEGLNRRGVENLLVVPPGSEVEREAKKRALPLHPLPTRGELDLPFLFRFRALVRSEKPDLVHLHSRRGADILGGLGARWAGVPAVLSRRVDNPELPWAVGSKYKLYDAVITISESIRRLLLAQGLPPEKVHCVHSALDPEPFLGPCRRDAFREEFGLGPRDFAIGMAAQFIHRKGHDDLLQAIPSILKEHSSARFLLFGRGPLHEEVARKVREAGLDNVVRLPGFRDDLPEILPCLDLLVHPATMEGLGVILLQASAAGVPIVACEVGGVPEVVAHGETGLLVPPESPGPLAEAVSALLGNPDRGRAMGNKGRARIRESFSVDRMVEGNLAVYRGILGRAE